jgi:hypothetical protein
MGDQQHCALQALELRAALCARTGAALRPITDSLARSFGPMLFKQVPYTMAKFAV